MVVWIWNVESNGEGADAVLRRQAVLVPESFTLRSRARRKHRRPRDLRIECHHAGACVPGARVRRSRRLCAKLGGERVDLYVHALSVRCGRRE